MANSFNLRLKQVSGVAPAGLVRNIALLLGVALLAAIVLWQAQLLPLSAGSSEGITIQSIAMPTSDSIVVEIKNSGADSLTVAQVQVDAAYWTFKIEPGASLAPASQATLTIPYVWVPDEPHIITIVTRSGATFEGQIDAPSLGSIR